MKQHFSEADLLETYYTQPGDSMPVMMHLADCSECAARYERLERKLRSMHSCEPERPATFWARQRLMVMRKIDARRARASAMSRIGRVAAAAALVLILAGVVTWRSEIDKPVDHPAVVQQATASLDNPSTGQLDNSEPADPWQSEELKEYGSMVEWESWVDSNPKNGDKSL